MGTQFGVSNFSYAASLISCRKPAIHFLSPVLRKPPSSVFIKQRRGFLTLVASSASAGATSESAVLDGSSFGKVGPNDLMIVGPGVLGRIVAEKWREEHPGCQIVGRTATSDHHTELVEMGIRPCLKGTEVSDKFPYVIFCAPPSRTADYSGELRDAASIWNGEGTFLFTSSSALYDCNDNGSCDEDSPVIPIGRSPRTDLLLSAEKVALDAGGCVVRLAGLYKADRGAHVYWLRKGIVDVRPDHIVNLIHYKDAASLTVVIMKKKLRSRIFLGCDNHPLSRQEIMDLVNKSGKFSEKFEAFTGTSDPLGKKLNNLKTRTELGWEPKYPSFSHFLGVQTETPGASFRTKKPEDINVVVVGSTGYIGNFVVKELVKRGLNVIAIAREKSGIKGKNKKDKTLDMLDGANVCFSDVTQLDELEKSLEGLGFPIDVVVSCLASRNGGVKDSWKIDYEATENSLVAGRKFGASHFVLLSAICVQKPLLEFQKAKLKFEADLAKEAESDEGFTYSIVRPTAFFKSLGGQVELVKDGKPYVMFGDGKLCACKPISESDLASFIADCVLSEKMINQVLPIGGPGKALTPLEQGEMLFKLLGKEPKFLKVPIEIMDFVIGVLDFLVKIFPSLEDAAEFGKIGRYYAAESMLVWEPETGEYNADKTPGYGADTLEDFFKKVLTEGMEGQELGEQAIF